MFGEFNFDMFRSYMKLKSKFEYFQNMIKRGRPSGTVHNQRQTSLTFVILTGHVFSYGVYLMKYKLKTFMTMNKKVNDVPMY
jgi:hypothetical protein